MVEKWLTTILKMATGTKEATNSKMVTYQKMANNSNSVVINPLENNQLRPNELKHKCRNIKKQSLISAIKIGRKFFRLKADRKKWMVSHKKINKSKKIINRNIQNNLRVIQWNKGSANIMNQINEIKDIIKENKPEVLILNEANFYSDEDISSIKIEGYNIEEDQLMDDFNVNRTLMYIKNNLTYERHREFESKNKSAITIAVGFKYMKKIWILAY